MSSLASLLPRLTLLAALVEFALLRGVLRLGPFLPQNEATLPLYRLGEGIGLAAMNLALLAAAALLVLLSAGLDWRRPGQAALGALVLLAVGVNLLLGALLPLLPGPAGGLLQPAVTAAAVLAVAGSAVRAGHGRAALGLIAAAQVLALAHVLTQSGAGLGVRLPGAGLLAFAAEGLALAAALALPWSFRPRPGRRQLSVGLAVAALALVVRLLGSWVVATMTMWTLAFSLFLPGVLYAAALGAAVACLLTLRRDPRSRPLAAGLLLIALAGLKLDFTYFALLSLAGLLVVQRQLLPEGRERPAPLAAPRMTECTVSPGSI